MEARKKKIINGKKLPHDKRIITPGETETTLSVLVRACPALQRYLHSTRGSCNGVQSIAANQLVDLILERLGL